MSPPAPGKMRPRVKEKTGRDGTTFYFGFAVVFAGCVCILSESEAAASQSCNMSRNVFTNSWGVITDGPSGSNYTQDSHCEWLIEANNTKQFITLTFRTMGTECSYDYLFVYDGNSFKAPLLGSFSGKTEPQQVVATSGAMLILLYSDTNYVLDGFHAEFSVSDCRGNCSSHGACVGHRCACHDGWGGADCGRAICPEGCGAGSGHGRCDGSRCVCSPGFTGQACSLGAYSDGAGNRWHWLSHSEAGLEPRAAHTAVYDNATDSLYVFGGYDLNRVLSGLAVFRFAASRWEDEFGAPLAAVADVVSSEDLAAAFQHAGNGKEDKSGVPSKSSFFRQFLFTLADNSTLSIRQHEGTESPASHTHLSRVGRDLPGRSQRDSVDSEAELESVSLEGQRLVEDGESVPWDDPAPSDSEEQATVTPPVVPGPNRDESPETSAEDDVNRVESDDGKVDDVVQEEGERPEPRYGHAACRYPGGFALYGGKLGNGTLSAELWLFNVTSRRWSLRALASSLRPPRLTRHSLTLAGTHLDWLYLFGGSTTGGEFLSLLFRIRLSSPETEQWSEIRPRGGKELDMRVVAHSAAYHAAADSLLVYGGVVTGVARFSKLSDRMFAFRLDTRHWAEIMYPRAQLRDTYVPRERAFHTSTIIGNYLVVFGGYSHRHNKEEICYDNQMYLYHLGCHTWVSHDVLGNSEKAFRYPKTQGVFAHAADVRHGNTLLVVGGYHGNVNADLLAYTLPQMLASRDGETYEPEAVCYKHRSLMECTANPECGWCSADEVCYGRTIGINCTTNLQTTRCPGVCPALGDCHSCLVHGAASRGPATLASAAVKLRLGQCTWCVQNARCHHKDDNYGVCGLREDTPSQVPGYWGPKGTEVAQVSQCRLLDRRPGLTFLKYYHPVNFDQPDSVTIINATTVDYKVPMAMTRTERKLAGQMTARLLGFLRPPDSWAQAPERLLTCASYSAAVLTIRGIGSLEQPSMVANLTAGLPRCEPATWPGGTEAVLKPGRYLVDFQSRLDTDPKGTASPHQQSKMELLHTLTKNADNAKVFTFEYLEPFANGSCDLYTNCLQCLTDSLCGWCELNGKCFPRELNETAVCTVETETGIVDWRYLTLVTSSCVNCSNLISCESCVGDGSLCEWWTDDALCMRRLRDPDAVRDIGSCPVPCHLRGNCSQCLDERGRCVWCDAMQECFSFSVYTSEYQFGLCRQWVDQRKETEDELRGVVPRTRNEKCKSCGRHANCSDCLKTLSCGWCHSVDNPISGVCVQGDFNHPYGEDCNAVIAASFNASESSWAYAACPDVDECSLHIARCHADAVCTNTRGSYTCACRRGFLGDGVDTCAATCFHACVNGYCTGAPDFVCKCNLGWTGVDCATNCGCNNHSTCTKGVGVCDQCQDWTMGERCERCLAGSYGNATAEGRGCHGCNCNEHGSVASGICDMNTGVCFCQDNTEGVNCDKCARGYYGDPRHGGTCFYQCVARGMLTGSAPQGLGSRLGQLPPWESRLGAPPTRECLWIVSPNNMQNKTDASVIQFTIHDDINVACQENSVYVYDGLPDFVSATAGHQRSVLGMFCSQDTEYPVTVEARSGILTVFYKQGDLSEGFNASYSVINCPDLCVGNRTCLNGQCVCKEGHTGVGCADLLCPNNCSYEKQQGGCDKGYGRCICSPDFGGDDCSMPLTPAQIVFTELFDSSKLADSLDHLRKTVPRFGHSLVADRRGALWMFGGYSLSNGPLNDIRLFDTKNNTWVQVTIDSTQDANMPQRRYFHAAEIVISRREIYVHGGLTQKEKVVGLSNNTLSDFWKFDLKNHYWSDMKREKEPPPLAGHTLTLRRDRDSESLVLIGGFSPRFGFLESVWEFDIKTGAWDTIVATGNWPLGVYGHSTVYHAGTQTLYVFGGYTYSINRTFISNKLYAFHYPSKFWSVLPTNDEYNPSRLPLPRARFLHTAVTTDSYMLVIGGRTQPLNASDSIVAYSYACNVWINLLDHDIGLVGSPPPPTFAHAMTLDAETGSAYVIGGFDGGIRSTVTRVRLPRDLCQLWDRKDRCLRLAGCGFCALFGDDGTNSTHCYANNKPAVDECTNPRPLQTLNSNLGVKCDAEWISRRNCDQYSTCSECVARYPHHLAEPQVCKWCASCLKDRCVPVTAECRCSQRAITEAEQCPERRCPATDCDKCMAVGSCVWTRQVLFTAELGVQVTGEPVYDWNCVDHDIPDRLSFKEKSMPPGKCPPRCSDHRDCRSCLAATGAEGGWHECRWSVQLNECLSPSYQPLYCAGGGVCGLVLREGNAERCPQPCAVFTQCSSCLRHAHCGWCSLDGGNVTGRGICTEGSLDSPSSGPSHSNCDLLYAHQVALARAASAETTLTVVAADSPTSDIVGSQNGSFSWHYVGCPPENECLNQHHTCDNRSEQCVDLEHGFHCVCGHGYTLDKKSACVPVCAQGCVRGECVEPNKCVCEFGYVGANCSIQCQCNGHSDCAGPDRLAECLECRNNTKGAQCEKCMPLFVGDPTNNGQCVPCIEFCNGHTHVCVNDSFTAFPLRFQFPTTSPTDLPLSESELQDYLVEGAIKEARCIGCRNRTSGYKCRECISGTFRGSPDERKACRPCECHGHGDTCDPVSGEKCNCQNNTESDPTCQSGGGGGSGKNANQQCWMVQCSKCRESYMGTPTLGHQCYRQMTVDSKFCFDAKQLEECKMKPKPLYPGQSVFFVVQPRFMNVDIRIIVDVTQGALDVYLSPRDDTFVVSINSSTGIHHVAMDEKFQNYGEETEHVHSKAARMQVVELVGPGGRVHPPNASNLYVVMKQDASGLATFITLLESNTFLLVRNVRDRLVLSLPKDNHLLGMTRFYLALTAAATVPADAAAPRPSYGMIFFHQDQLHIDLFVFFSVFFSCFFLFLAACVVAWKAKMATEIRRARRRHVVEMLHMAKRPFATITLVVNCSDEPSSAPSSASPYRKKRKATGCGDLRPVAVEPTDDGVAAVGTVFVRLPGGTEAPVRLALGSSLILLARVYPLNGRVFLRRRSSHAHVPS